MELRQSELRSWLHRFEGGGGCETAIVASVSIGTGKAGWNDMPGAVLAKKARAAQAKKRLWRYWQ